MNVGAGPVRGSSPDLRGSVDLCCFMKLFHKCSIGMERYSTTSAAGRRRQGHLQHGGWRMVQSYHTDVDLGGSDGKEDVIRNGK